MSRRRKREDVVGQQKENASEETSGISLDQLHEIAKRRKLEREKQQTVEVESSNSVSEFEDNGVESVNEAVVAVETSDYEGLAVLTQHEAKGKVASVNYQLPSWVTQYCPIKEDIIADSVSLDSFNIHHKVRSNLKSMNIQSLFPVQATVMPDIINATKGPLLTQTNGIAPSDICVCAPTGCGKTLTYVIPIVNALVNCTTCKLRALVVVPSQDLALQVKSVFKDVAKGSCVKTGVLCGQHTLNEEIDAIVSPLGSKVDVLVCTPGRLVSHLQQCSLLSMCDLRFLVVDEADRIFDQCYHNWLACVIDAVQRPSSIDATTALFASSSVPFLFPSLFDALPKLASPQKPSSSFFSPSATVSEIFTPKQPLQKLLFSATLSLDPEKLSLLRLRNPKLYSVSPVTGETIGEAVLPSTLSEYTLVCKPDYKPLYLLHILRVLEEDRAILCFTHSKVSTHRLKLVLQQYEVIVDEVSSSISQEARKAVLNKFASGKIKVLVCSDGMSRGMDIPSVNSVVNYDAPAHFKSYLHRVGRTARAGAKGNAYTILTYEEVANFNRIVRNAQRNKKIKRIAVSEKEIKPYIGSYSQALENVAAIVEQRS